MARSLGVVVLGSSVATLLGLFLASGSAFGNPPDDPFSPEGVEKSCSRAERVPTPGGEARGRIETLALQTAAQTYVDLERSLLIATPPRTFGSFDGVPFKDQTTYDNLERHLVLPEACAGDSFVRDQMDLARTTLREEIDAAKADPPAFSRLRFYQQELFAGEVPYLLAAALRLHHPLYKGGEPPSPPAGNETRIALRRELMEKFRIRFPHAWKALSRASRSDLDRSFLPALGAELEHRASSPVLWSVDYAGRTLEQRLVQKFEEREHAWFVEILAATSVPELDARLFFLMLDVDPDPYRSDIAQGYRTAVREEIPRQLGNLCKHPEAILTQPPMVGSLLVAPAQTLADAGTSEAEICSLYHHEQTVKKWKDRGEKALFALMAVTSIPAAFAGPAALFPRLLTLRFGLGALLRASSMVALRLAPLTAVSNIAWWGVNAGSYFQRRHEAAVTQALFRVEFATLAGRDEAMRRLAFTTQELIWSGIATPADGLQTLVFLREMRLLEKARSLRGLDEALAHADDFMRGARETMSYAGRRVRRALDWLTPEALHDEPLFEELAQCLVGGGRP